MKKNILESFGTRVRELRKEKGYSQEYLAELVNLHRTYIGQIERGEKNLSLLNIEKLAKAFSMSISELLNFH